MRQRLGLTERPSGSRVVLEYALPEHEHEARLAMRAGDMHGFIEDFQEELRQFRKYRKLKKNQAELIDELERIWFAEKPYGL